MATTKWMVHPETQMVMARNELLVNEEGYRPYDGPLPVIDPALGFPVLREGCEFQNDSQKEREAKEKAESIFNKHKDAIVAAFKDMPKVEFVTTSGMPNLLAIEKMVGFKPSKEEREAAFKEYQASKDEADIEEVNA